MILLDTDTLTLFAAGHPRVTERVQAATVPIAITIVTRIEILQGRFDLLLKAASIALAPGATLVNRNLRHFRQVPGLDLENWANL